MPPRSITNPLIFLIVCLSMSCAFFLLWQQDPSVAHENHLIENIQAMFLFLSLVPVLVKSHRERIWDVTSGFLLLSFLSIFLREVDLRPFPLPQFVILLSTKGRNILLVFGWVLVAYALIRNFKISLRKFVALGSTAAGLYFMTGCLFYVLALPFDEGIFGIARETNKFLEEFLETIGTVSFSFSAFCYCRRM